VSRIANQKLFKEAIPLLLSSALDLRPDDVSLQDDSKLRAGGADVPDFFVHAGSFTFAVKCKGNGDGATVAMAARTLRAYVDRFDKNSIPVVLVPFMGEVGSRLCEEMDVCWMDLSGNARLRAPGLRVAIEGKPNRFIRRGRPRSVFAPKSARIARQLLIEPQRAFTQRELSQVTQLNEGFTSRIVRQLEEQRLIVRDNSGAVRVADFQTLLDALREAYDFSKHTLLRGHIAARSSDEILRRSAAALREAKVQHAATGLAGAWLWQGFAGFRLVALYVADLPSSDVQRAMSFREVDHGENVWLVQPNDEGVFQGTGEREGIACVHPVQLYLDLKNHPERSAEAADALRTNILNQSAHV